MTLDNFEIDSHFINGAWVRSTSSRTIDVYDSNTATVIGHAPEGTEAEAQAAVEAARAAQPAWAALSPAERGTHLRAIAAGIEAHREELARLISLEVGAPLAQALSSHTGAPIYSFTAAADIAEKYSFVQYLDDTMVVREPIGVVGAIAAWNFPLHLVTVKAAYALAAGNTVVVKPSEVAPLTAAVLCDIVSETNLPAGVLNVVFGTGPEVGEAIVTNPDVGMITFTGSTRAGRRIGELAAQQVKKVTLELGGKSPLVILDSADLERATRFGIADLMVNNGQRCDALTRMVVPRGKLEEVERLVAGIVREYAVGPSIAEGTEVGPLVSAVQLERVRGYIQRGRDEGARVVVGGSDTAPSPSGYFVEPTVFSDVDRSMSIVQDEIFGPVLVIQTYDTVDEAVEIANDTVYGLHAAVWAGEPDEAIKVANRIDAGMVTINDATLNLNAPFGGYKQSGLGREFGLIGFEEFLEVKKLEVPAS